MPGLAVNLDAALQGSIHALRARRYDSGHGLAATVDPLQVGVVTKGGTETIMQALNAASEEGQAIFTLVVNEAFDSISRASTVALEKNRTVLMSVLVFQWAYE